MGKTQKERPLAIFIPSRTLIAGGFSVLSFFIYLISLALSHPFLNFDCSWLGFLLRFRSLTNQCSTVLQKRVTASPLLSLRGASQSGCLFKFFSISNYSFPSNCTKSI